MSETKRILVVTGLSGSGKSTAIRALEDAGWSCIDNLPAPLVLKVAELSDSKARLAFGIDAREGGYLKDVPQALDEVRRAGHHVEVLFLDSSDETLTRRYSETRRRHPLAAGGTVEQGIAKERSLLGPLREHAEHVIDTSAMTVHDLRRQVMSRFSSGPAGQLTVTMMSFGFKYGVPSNADLVFDVRFLPNPYFVPELKALTGKDSRVARYVLEQPDAAEFVDRVLELLLFLLPRYQREGKAYLTVAVGCTGGKHRSVAIAQALAERLDASPLAVGAQLFDRDMGKE